jgi:hypothetical protein
MIAIWCCRCGKDDDGWLRDLGPCVLDAGLHINDD